MDVIFDWNLDNMIYNGLITLRLCGFPFSEIRLFQEVVDVDVPAVAGITAGAAGIRHVVRRDERRDAPRERDGHAYEGEQAQVECQGPQRCRGDEEEARPGDGAGFDHYC